MCGWVEELPTIVTDDRNGQFVFAKGRIKTIRGVRRFGEKTSNIKYDNPLIYTVNPEMCQKMATWQIGDLVEIKGALTTKDINKCTNCPVCKQKNSQPGNAVYVTPIHCSVREHGLSSEEAVAKLKDLCEISNNITLIGVVCREPQLYQTRNRSKITSYQLAVRRKFKILEDLEENRTDFPWVKSFGGIGLNDAMTLKKGTYIFLDGWLQSRKFERETTCEHCGSSYKWIDWALEIIPYACEYVRNYKTIEELKDEERKHIEEDYRKFYTEDVILNAEPLADRSEIEKALDEYNAYEENNIKDLLKASND